MTTDPYRAPIEALVAGGQRLGANAETICTACQYLHRFRRYFDAHHYDLYLMAATALYLAAKVTESHLRLRDVIQVFYQTVHRTKDELKDIKVYQSLKDSIVDSELLLLRALAFRVDGQLPHRFLGIYVQTLTTWMRDDYVGPRLEASAWALANDYVCLDPRSLDYRPQHVAIACVELSLRCLNYKIPYDDEALIPWMEAFDDRLNKQDVEEVIQQISGLYSEDTGGSNSSSGGGAAGTSSGHTLPHKHSYDSHFNYKFDFRSEKSSH